MPPTAPVPLPPGGRARARHWLVILIAFVLLAFIGIPVFLSWKHNRG